MKDISKLFLLHLDKTWDTNDATIIYSVQQVDAGLDSWILPKLLSISYDITRKNSEIGTGVFHFGIFTSDENEYSLLNISNKIKNIFKKKYFNNLYIFIRTLEPQFQFIGTSKDVDLSRTIQHAVITIPFEFENG